MKNNTSKALAFPHDSYGFTLIEMLLVVGIIAVLTAVSIPLFSNSLENTKIHTDEANERAAKGAAMTEYLTGGTFPNGGGGIAYYDAAAGQWKSEYTGITPYGKCETDGHDSLVLGGTMSSADGSLSLFWVNLDSSTRFPIHSETSAPAVPSEPEPAPEPDPVAPDTAIDNWEYDTLDETNKTVTLKYYKGNETDVIVYGSYRIDGEIYKTQLASNTEDVEFETSYMFNGYPSEQSNCKNIKTITFSNAIDTSAMTNMAYMFANCNALISLDLRNFNTSNVTNMESMFDSCSSLTSLDVSKFNTSNVTSMNAIFANCKALTSLDLRNFNTSKVTNMNAMFSGCNALTSLDVSKFNTSDVASMESMFYCCNALTSLDVSKFNTSDVASMKSMFLNCKALTSLDVSKFNTSNVTSMNAMFAGCNALTSLDLRNFNTSKVDIWGMKDMFQNCSSLTSLNLSNFDTSKVLYLDNMFQNCSSLTSLNLSSFNTSNVWSTSYMFSGCTKLNSLTTTPGTWVKRAAGCTTTNMFTDCPLSDDQKGAFKDAT